MARAMHTTTVRFDREDWQRLGTAAELAGVPKAQYIRDATIARLASASHLPELARLRRDVDQLAAKLAGRGGRR